MNKEIRLLNDNINVDENSKIIEGYASVFNSSSKNLGGFYEFIDPHAFDDVIEKSDVFALLNHKSDNGILARSKYGKGTLQLKIDDKGLFYSFEVPDTSLGNDTYQMIKRGDISSSSFAFTVEKDEWVKNSDGTYNRYIKKVNQLFDVSAVYTPAYDFSSVECKRFAEILEEEKAANELQMKLADEAEKRKEELNNYYSDFESRINNLK